MTGGTDSRRWGLVLIAAVLVAAAVVPNLSARKVPGTAQAGPVPGPPAVGDCVNDPIDPSWENPDVVHTASGAVTVHYAYPQVGLSPCTGSKYGEVAAVIADPAVPKVENTPENGTTVNDSNTSPCAFAAYRYVGAAMVGTEIKPLMGPWFRSQVIAWAASVPSKRQQAVGQHWLACIVYLGARPDELQNFGEVERYDGVLYDALSTGQERNRLGTCAVETDLNSRPVGCGRAHQSEILASGGMLTDPVPRSQLQSSCSRVIAQSTGIPDVTTVGFTIVVATRDGEGTPITTPSIPMGALLTCGVTAAGGRTLNGSLLALGNDPIPWT